MNKWLYQAAGTAGIVSGFLMLGAGGAQADDRDEDFNALIGEALSPTSGLPPLSLPLTGTSLGTSPLDAAGLSDLPVATNLPLPGELVPLGGDPIGLPARFADMAFRTLPAGDLPGQLVDAGFRTLPASDLTGQLTDTAFRTLPAPDLAGNLTDTAFRTLPAPDLTGQLTDTAFRTLPAPDLTGQLVGTGFRTLPALAPTPVAGSAVADPAGIDPASADQGFRTLPAPAPMTIDSAGPTYPDTGSGHGHRTLPAPATTGSARPTEIVGSMSFLTQPITRALLGGRTLGDVVAVGDPTSQIPLAGPIIGQTTRSLPLVSDLTAGPSRQTAPVSPQSQRVAASGAVGQESLAGGEQLPAVIAQQLVSEGGYSPELLDPTGPELLGGGLPLIGNALNPVTGLVGVGSLPQQLPVVGPMVAPMLDSLPVVGRQSAPAAPALTRPAVPLPAAPATNPADAASERPVAGEDPEYVESLI